MSIDKVFNQKVKEWEWRKKASERLLTRSSGMWISHSFVQSIEREYQMDHITFDRHICINVVQDISFKKDIILRQNNYRAIVW